MATELTNIIQIDGFHNGEKASKFVHKSDFDPTGYTLIETITDASEPVQVWMLTDIIERWNAQ